MEYSCSSRMRTNKCTTDSVMLKDKKGKKVKNGQYCKMYYRMQPEELSKYEKIANCNSSMLGCVQCQEVSCTACWNTGYERYINRNVVE